MMAFAYGYFNVAKGDVDGVANTTCLTYENVVSGEDLWKKNEIVWVLGRKFHLPKEKQKLINFIRSRLWFTYRKGFSAIGGTGPTSDSGWGCMLRCGQMMLAQALSVLVLSNDWEWQPNSEEQPTAYKNILKQLSDHRSSCYSIHQIAQMGVQEGKEVGQWFGPNTIAQVLRRLSQFDQDNVLAFHVAMDNTVCINDLVSLCSSTYDAANNKKPSCSQSNNDNASSPSCSKDTHQRRSHSESHIPSVNSTEQEFWKPLFLMIPLRLGLADINPLYFSHLKEVLQWEESVGVIGGKPNHAYYFVGSSDDSLIFLDPHTTQQCVDFPDVDSGEYFEDESYHCDNPGRMSLTQLDPSLALGFICPTREDFDSLCQKLKMFKKTPTSYPLVEVLDSMPDCQMIESRILTVKAYSRQKRKERNQGGDVVDDNACLALDSDESFESDEEFEILDFQ